ncbi:MAG: hypothetical protein ACOYKA_00730 [Legionellaceae bacterium]
MKEDIEQFTRGLALYFKSTSAQHWLQKALIEKNDGQLTRVFNDYAVSTTKSKHLYKKLMKTLGSSFQSCSDEQPEENERLDKLLEAHLEQVKNHIISVLLSENKSTLQSKLRKSLDQDTWKALKKTWNKQIIVEAIVRSALMSYGQTMTLGFNECYHIKTDARGIPTQKLTDKQLDACTKFNETIYMKIQKYANKLTIPTESFAQPQQIQQWKHEARMNFRKSLIDKNALIADIMFLNCIYNEWDIPVFDGEEIEFALTDFEKKGSHDYHVDTKKINDYFKGINVLSLTTTEKITYAAAIHKTSDSLNHNVESSFYQFYKPQTLPDPDEEDLEQLSLRKAEHDKLLNEISTSVFKEEIQYAQALKQLNQLLKAKPNPVATILQEEIMHLGSTQGASVFSIPELSHILQRIHQCLINPPKNNLQLSILADRIQALPALRKNHQRLVAALIILSASCLLITSITATLFSGGLLAPLSFPLIFLTTDAIITAVSSIVLCYKANVSREEIKTTPLLITQSLKALSNQSTPPENEVTPPPPRP